MNQNQTPHHVREVSLDGATLRLSFWLNDTGDRYNSIFSVSRGGFDFQTDMTPETMRDVAQMLIQQAYDTDLHQSQLPEPHE